MLINKLRRLFFKLSDAQFLRAREFSGRKVLLPESSRAEISQSEPWMFALLELCSRQFGSGLLDVGVNLGQTLSAYKLIDPDGEYLGLEPNPECVSYAEQLVQANGFQNIVIVPCALTEEAGLLKLDFYQPTQHDSSASIIPNFRADRKVYRTQVIAGITGPQLEAAFDLSAFNIVKVDVEGAESVVLSQLSFTFENTRPVVIAEVLPAYSNENQARLSAQQAIEALLKANNYKILRLSHDETRLFGFEPCDEFGIHSDILKSDYLFVPDEKHEAFAKRAKDAGFQIELQR